MRLYISKAVVSLGSLSMPARELNRRALHQQRIILRLKFEGTEICSGTSMAHETCFTMMVECHVLFAVFGIPWLLQAVKGSTLLPVYILLELAGHASSAAGRPPFLVGAVIPKPEAKASPMQTFDTCETPCRNHKTSVSDTRHRRCEDTTPSPQDY